NATETAPGLVATAIHPQHWLHRLDGPFRHLLPAVFRHARRASDTFGTGGPEAEPQRRGGGVSCRTEGDARRLVLPRTGCPPRAGLPERECWRIAARLAPRAFTRKQED